MSGVRTSDRLALVSSGMSAPAARAEVTSSGVPWFGWALVGGGVLVIGGLCAFASHVAGGRAAASRARFAAALSEAIKDGDSKTVSTMLKQQRLDVNALHQGELPLVVSVHTGDTDIVLELVGAGADVNKRMNGDTTALMAACTLGRTAIVKVLLKAGADPSLTDETGFHAAHMAARMGHLPCLQELGAACPGILDTCRASDGATPLMLAAADNHVRRWCTNTLNACLLCVVNASMLHNKRGGVDESISILHLSCKHTGIPSSCLSHLPVPCLLADTRFALAPDSSPSRRQPMHDQRHLGSNGGRER